jgi:hypothetical protein
MCRGHPERVVDPERLSVLDRSLTHGGIAGMTKADMPPQSEDIAFVEDVPDQSVSLLDMITPVIGQHSRRILTAVLDGQHGIVQFSHDFFVVEYANHTAHEFTPGSKSHYCREAPKSQGVSACEWNRSARKTGKEK